MITYRTYTDKGDLPALANIFNLSNQADAIEETVTVEELSQWLRPSETFDPTRNVFIAEADGEPVAWARIYDRLRGTNLRVYWQWGYTVPQWRRRGTGRQLLTLTENRAHEMAQAFPAAEPRQLQLVAEETAIGKQVLGQQFGYKPVRYFCFMQRMGLATLPERSLPPGFQFLPVDHQSRGGAPHQQRQARVEPEHFDDVGCHVPQRRRKEGGGESHRRGLQTRADGLRPPGESAFIPSALPAGGDRRALAHARGG